MIGVWDIVESIFSTIDSITRPQISNRRPVPEFSSVLQFAFVVSLSTAAAAGSETMMAPATTANGSSEFVVLQRSRIVFRRPPAKETREGVDFVRGRSGEKLANSFKAYFKPSAEIIDDSSDEGFVFD